MSKSRVTATAKPTPGETYQVVVTAADAYPDGLRQARIEAVAGVHDLIADAITQYGQPVTSDDA